MPRRGEGARERGEGHECHLVPYDETLLERASGWKRRPTPPDWNARWGSVLIEWLKDSEQASPRRAFTACIKRVLIPGRLPGIVLPEVGNLMEIKTMLAESVIEWTEQWKQQGRQEGRLEGRLEGKLEGRLEGELVLLERQLGKRFGPLTEETRARLRKATTEQLETWAERVLEAKTLEDVFGA